MNRTAYFESHAHYDHKLYKGTGPELVKELEEYGIDKIDQGHGCRCRKGTG